MGPFNQTGKGCMTLDEINLMHRNLASYFELLEKWPYRCTRCKYHNIVTPVQKGEILCEACTVMNVIEGSRA